MGQSPFDRVFPLIYTKTIETFLIVYQQRSFTRAAEVLGLSQSAVSQNIIRLEETLGVTLFARDVRPISPTPEANVLMEQIEKQVRDMSGTIGQIRRHNFVRPIVRVGIADSLSPNIAPHIVQVLAPHSMRISVLTGTSNVLVRQLRQHDVDLIVCGEAFENEPQLARRFLFGEPHVIAMPPSVAIIPDNLSWSDLKFSGVPFVRYSSRSSSGRLIEAFLDRIGLELPLRFEADTSRVLLSLVAEGMGWALTTPLCLLQCQDMVARMHLLPAPPPTAIREMFIVTRSGEYESLAEKVTDICRAELRANIVPMLVRIAPWTQSMFSVVAENGTGREFIG
jgi:DNA-binding transcriptional LysR family regulator